MRVSDYKINDAPGMAGKVFLVTGGTSGLGRETVVALANHPSPPAHIYFTGRSAPRAEDVLARCPSRDAVSFIACDLASLASVKQAAQVFLAQSPRLDVLMLNAGILGVPSGHTADGYEIQFGTNHVGHAFLFRLLAPTLGQAPDARLVALSSDGYQIATGGIDLAKVREDVSGPMGVGWSNYGRSKMANLTYGVAVAERYPQIYVANIHPGVVATELVSGMSFLNKLLVYVTSLGRLLSSEQGAFNQLWAATTPRENLAPSGTYYVPVGQPTAVKLKAADKAATDALWKWTERELAPHLA